MDLSTVQFSFVFCNRIVYLCIFDKFALSLFVSVCLNHDTLGACLDVRIYLLLLYLFEFNRNRRIKRIETRKLMVGLLPRFPAHRIRVRPAKGGLPPLRGARDNHQKPFTQRDSTSIARDHEKRDTRHIKPQEDLKAICLNIDCTYDYTMGL